jgi:uncharacterized protein
MPRLIEACHAQARPSADDCVQWQAAGERRREGAAEPQTWLQLTLDTEVKLVCQRCLGPVETRLRIERWFRFVAGEEQAAQLDAESEEDVLASSRTFDLHALAEDELLLALPLVPRHEVCLQPLLPAVTDALPDGTETVAEPSPFAVLAALKRRAH